MNGSNDFFVDLPIYLKKRPAPGWLAEPSSSFLVGNPELNYKPSFATVLGWGGRSKQ